MKLREDPTKGGMSREQVLKDWNSLSQLPNLNLKGFMIIPPMMFSLKERKELFVECRDLANECFLTDCSMGMSSDWKEAVEAGSTWLRLGSSLFGTRPPHLTKFSQI